MKKIFPIFVMAVGIGLFTVLWIGSISTAYAQWRNKESPEATLDGVDAVQAIEIANQWRWSKKEIRSRVTPREVVFKFSNRKEKRIPLPEEKTYVAIAPYIKKTHTWIDHNISSCTGELVNKEFKVKAIDQDDNILFDETVTTLRNGFFELWLPRNRRIELKIQGLDRKASGTIETFDYSKTCITTFQLK